MTFQRVVEVDVDVYVVHWLRDKVITFGSDAHALKALATAQNEILDLAAVEESKTTNQSNLNNDQQRQEKENQEIKLDQEAPRKA